VGSRGHPHGPVLPGDYRAFTTDMQHNTLDTVRRKKKKREREAGSLESELRGSLGCLVLVLAIPADYASLLLSLHSSALIPCSISL